jgi:hypothetical protein
VLRNALDMLHSGHPGPPVCEAGGQTLMFARSADDRVLGVDTTPNQILEPMRYTGNQQEAAEIFTPLLKRIRVAPTK